MQLEHTIGQNVEVSSTLYTDALRSHDRLRSPTRSPVLCNHGLVPFGKFTPRLDQQNGPFHEENRRSRPCTRETEKRSGGAETPWDDEVGPHGNDRHAAAGSFFPPAEPVFEVKWPGLPPQGAGISDRQQELRRRDQSEITCREGKEKGPPRVRWPQVVRNAEER
jgi:hypothetical protein